MITMNSSPASESETVTHSLSQVVHDMVTLAELQVQLLRSDALEALQRFLRPLAIFAVGVLLFLGAIPACLTAIALGLVAAGLPPAAAYALVAVTSLIAAGALAAWAWQRIQRLPVAFARSREELARNITWVKEAVIDLAAKPHPPPEDLRTNRVP